MWTLVSTVRVLGCSVSRPVLVAPLSLVTGVVSRNYIYLSAMR